MGSQDNFAYLLPFIMATFGCIFLASERLNIPAARCWGIGYLAAAAGFSAPLVLEALPVEAVAVISNALFFAAFFFYGQALLVRFARPVLVAPRLLFGVLALGVVSYLIVGRHDLRSQLIVGDASLAVLLGIAVWTVRRDARTLVDRLLVGMAGLVVLETGIRVTMLFALTSNSTYASLDEFLNSDYAFFMQMGASIIGFLMALAVLGAVMWDIVSEQRRAAEQDPLTGLLNRRGFENALLRSFGPGPLAGTVFISDIDHFKQVNDRLGHAAGDQVILALTTILKHQLQQDAIVARFGGEEFVVFLPGTGLQDGARSAEEIRRSFANADWQTTGFPEGVTASFGVSAIARGDHSIHDAINRADALLYRAKEDGRNKVAAEGRSEPGSPQLRVISSK